ncbi:radical SAM protein [Candidatus Pacearchaeota archaeon]|nr:radical SAM protein [Candidatus Pacearchaeota archaeon]
MINGMILDGDKLSHHQDRVNAWMRGERIAPITIDMALTRACNMRCTFCYAMLQENEALALNDDKNKMSPKVIDRFLDDAAEVGVRGISFVSDGESTAHPYVYDAIQRGKRNGIDMAIGTNGMLLREERLEEMLSALTYIRFNFSGGEPARYAEIMGCREEDFYKVVDKIKKSVEIKRERKLDVTIGMQMVFMPQHKDQLMPLARLSKSLGVDYLVIKHCSDDELGSLGINYRDYRDCVPELKAAETESTKETAIVPKWSKLTSEGKRVYQRCYGAPFILQMSGSSLVAPCGMLFHDRYKQDFHIGSIAETPFKDIVRGDRYWEVMKRLRSEEFDAQRMCGALCLQHKVNERLYHLVEHGVPIPSLSDEKQKPLHVNFI